MGNTKGIIDRSEIERLTVEQGGEWGINHTRRLLKLIDLIGPDHPHDEEVVWTAAHLHDWGGYGIWAQPGVDHAVRSTQVAEAYLAEHGCPQGFVQHVLECIANHHNGNPGKSIEAVLLSDADSLDFLGVIGIFRDVSKTPRNLRKGYETALKRKTKALANICLDRSKQIAQARIATMDRTLAAFEEESFGDF